MSGIASVLVSGLKKCLSAADKHKLPSVAQASVWSSFHCLRVSKHIADQWSSFIAKTVPFQEAGESLLGLQLILDRMLKAMIKTKSEEAQTTDAVNFRLVN